MQRYRKYLRGCLLLTAAGFGIPSASSVAFADSVPESIRIQEQAEKAYETAPVVPIERGNAHHRESQVDEREGGSSGAYEPVNPTPPPTAQRHNPTK